jgi:hypothetical protein
VNLASAASSSLQARAGSDSSKRPATRWARACSSGGRCPAFRERVDRDRAHARGSELEREGDSVELSNDAGDCARGGELEAPVDVTRALYEKLDGLGVYRRGGFLHVLAVVDDQQRIAIDRGCFDSIRGHAKRGGDLGFYTVRVDRCKLHEPYTLRVATEATVTQLESGSCLAGSAHPVHGQQARFVEQPVELP